MCLDATKWDINYVLRSITATSDDFIRFLGAHGGSQLVQYRLSHWNPPPHHVVKLNVDGSYFQDCHRMGVGGVFRTSSCLCLGGFQGFVGPGDCFEAELLAVLVGLQFAWMKGWRDLIVETDALEVVQAVQDTNISFHKHLGAIQSIRDYTQRNWNVSVTHIFREGNHVADLLAKHGALNDRDVHWWEEPTPPVATALLRDSSLMSSFVSFCFQ
ncbi:Ribonuclease H domain [Sesbania bispinosa]|nr:Ribonuclease H domain [Sesbania bispinosa]